MTAKILIIEDEETVLQNISTLLKEEGYTVYSAADGELGLKLAEKILPDLIISDILMPYKNGYEVLKKLSEDSNTSNIPFLFLTAKTTIEDLRVGMELGADDYIFKPYKADKLLRAIETRLSRFNTLKEAYSNSAANKNNQSKTISCNLNGKQEKVKISDILYISSENQYSQIHSVAGAVYIFKKSLTHWETILPKNDFIRIHRSNIINTNFITQKEFLHHQLSKVYLKNLNKPFDVSRRYAVKLKSNENSPL